MRRPDHAVVLGGRAVFELSWPEAPERGGRSLPGPGAYAVAPALRPTPGAVSGSARPWLARHWVSMAGRPVPSDATGAHARKPAMRATSTGPMNPMKKIL